MHELRMGINLANGYGRDILTRHEMVWNQIPSHLKYDEITGSEHALPPQRYVMMSAYMDQNYSRFLLHRKLVKTTECSRESLYKISRSLLATVLQLIALSDQTSDMHRDISWFVSSTLSSEISFLNAKSHIYSLLRTTRRQHPSS